MSKIEQHENKSYPEFRSKNSIDEVMQGLVQLRTQYFIFKDKTFDINDFNFSDKNIVQQEMLGDIVQKNFGENWKDNYISPIIHQDVVFTIPKLFYCQGPIKHINVGHNDICSKCPFPINKAPL